MIRGKNGIPCMPCYPRKISEIALTLATMDLPTVVLRELAVCHLDDIMKFKLTYI